MCDFIEKQSVIPHVVSVIQNLMRKRKTIIMRTKVWTRKMD